MVLVEDGDTGSVRKVAATREEGRKLAHEEAILRAIAHPGVVRVAHPRAPAESGGPHGDGSTYELLLIRVKGRALSELGRLSVEEVAGIGASIATTLADVHSLGIAHGAVSAEHVILEDGGGTVLCGFGSARVLDRDDDHPRRNDLADLAATLVGLCSPPDRHRMARVLRSARRPREGSNQLAQRLVKAFPGARLPATPHQGHAIDSIATSNRPTGDSRTRRAPAVVLLLIAIGLVGAAIVAEVLLASSRNKPPADPAMGPASTTPGPSQVDFSASGRRFEISSPNRVDTFLGHFGCSPQRVPIAVDLEEGAIWEFDSWPTAGRPQVARLAGRVEGIASASLRQVSKTCDVLVVTRHDHSSVEIDPLRR